MPKVFPCRLLTGMLKTGCDNFLCRPVSPSVKRAFACTRGYTMIELIVVVVLIGIMLSMSVPKIRQSILSNNLKSTTRRIIGLVKSTRDRAIQKQSVYNFHIDFAENKIWIKADAGDEAEGFDTEEFQSGRDNTFVLPPDVRVTDIWSRGGGTVAEGEGLIRFNEKGYIEPAVIHLEAENGDVVSLELTPFLGSIRIYDRYLDNDG